MGDIEMAWPVDLTQTRWRLLFPQIGINPGFARGIDSFVPKHQAGSWASQFALFTARPTLFLKALDLGPSAALLLHRSVDGHCGPFAIQ